MHKSLPPHDCRGFARKVFLVIDGELEPAEEEEFISDIQRCPHCLRQLNIERTFKDFLAQRIMRKKADTKVVKSIQNQLRNGISNLPH